MALNENTKVRAGKAKTKRKIDPMVEARLWKKVVKGSRKEKERETDRESEKESGRNMVDL